MISLAQPLGHPAICALDLIRPQLLAAVDLFARAPCSSGEINLPHLMGERSFQSAVQMTQALPEQEQRDLVGALCLWFWRHSPYGAVADRFVQACGLERFIPSLPHWM